MSVTELNSMRVLILGAGWYGCHAAAYLLRAGVDVHLVDQTDAFLQGASSRNQNRLHLGFHYPRSARTRSECARGFHRMLAEYPGITHRVPNNLYLIARESRVDADTYLKTLGANPLSTRDYGLPLAVRDAAVQGAARTDERMVDPDAARLHFEGLLAGRLLRFRPDALQVTPCSVRYGMLAFDCLVDCTYGQWDAPQEVYYELCLTLLYRYTGHGVPDFGVTVMDGPFFSLYPYKPAERLYTLTDVALTPLYTAADYASVSDYARGVTEQEVARVQERIERRVAAYLPDFGACFARCGHLLSTKTKYPTATDDRSMRHYIRHGGRVCGFYGGKLTGIFDMEPHLQQLVMRLSSASTCQRPS